VSHTLAAKRIIREAIVGATAAAAEKLLGGRLSRRLKKWVRLSEMEFYHSLRLCQWCPQRSRFKHEHSKKFHGTKTSSHRSIRSFRF